jgi:hypothetical protein
MTNGKVYQAAIVHTLANRPEDSLKDLREAFQKGYSVGMLFLCGTEFS